MDEATFHAQLEKARQNYQRGRISHREYEEIVEAIEHRYDRILSGRDHIEEHPLTVCPGCGAELVWVSGIGLSAIEEERTNPNVVVCWQGRTYRCPRCKTLIYSELAKE